MILSYKSKNASVISGSDVFRLYDTYGFPHDLTKEIALENGLAIDEAGFKSEQKKAQEKSRAAWGGSGEQDVTFYSILQKKAGDTQFTGYEKYEDDGKVLFLIKNGKEADELKCGESGEIILSKTPFYAQSGGQNADTGTIFGDYFKAQIEDVFKPMGLLFVHKVKVLEGNIKTGDLVCASIDIEYRKQTARHHTATHLLQKALREIFGDHITQAGSLVTNSYLRFDFTHYSAVKKDDLTAVENKVNAAIRANMSVAVENMKIAKARECGATALFGEKYGDIVRTVSVKNGNENFSMELCGGTHVIRTGDIGFFKIVSESSVAAGVRRIEAVCGSSAENYVLSHENTILKAAELLGSSKDEILNKIQKYAADYKKLEQELSVLKSRLISGEIDGYLKNIKEINGVKLLALPVKDADVKALREMSDKLREKAGSVVLIMASKNEDKSSFIVSATSDFVSKGVNAGRIAKAFAADIGGSGGGKPDFAQGGTKDVSKIDEALNNAEKYFK
ncbi:MAG: alanine--tRNA ligase, partial [Endomicrobium sp.]|jgi:alanyl-tRNA synthetase|nr:alanine--tRNA ligase [Endomicrobium sp.]